MRFFKKNNKMNPVVISKTPTTLSSPNEYHSYRTAALHGQRTMDADGEWQRVDKARCALQDHDDRRRFPDPSVLVANRRLSESGVKIRRTGFPLVHDYVVSIFGRICAVLRYASPAAPSAKKFFLAEKNLTKKKMGEEFRKKNSFLSVTIPPIVATRLPAAPASYADTDSNQRRLRAQAPVATGSAVHKTPREWTRCLGGATVTG